MIAALSPLCLRHEYVIGIFIFYGQCFTLIGKQVGPGLHNMACKYHTTVDNTQ